MLDALFNRVAQVPFEIELKKKRSETLQSEFEQIITMLKYVFRRGWIHHGQIPNSESRYTNSTNKGGMFGDINRTQYFVENMCFATETAPFYQNEHR